jgi:hypothetical protein
MMPEFKECLEPGTCEKCPLLIECARWWRKFWRVEQETEEIKEGDGLPAAGD